MTLPSLQGLSIFLVGMMGSGKSTVGKALARQLNYRFVDTDATIEGVTRQAIADIFQTRGEAAFRDLESQALNELAAYLRCVVATGGGAVLKQVNWSYLRQGLVIWLDAPVDLLVRRLQSDTSRPLLQVGDITTALEKIREQRLAYYQQADLTIPVQLGQSPEAIADLILKKIPTVLREAPLNQVGQDRQFRNN